MLGIGKTKALFLVKRECMAGPVVVSRGESTGLVVNRGESTGPTNACSQDAGDGTENLQFWVDFSG